MKSQNLFNRPINENDLSTTVLTQYYLLLYIYLLNRKYLSDRLLNYHTLIGDSPVIPHDDNDFDRPEALYDLLWANGPIFTCVHALFS